MTTILAQPVGLRHRISVRLALIVILPLLALMSINVVEDSSHDAAVAAERHATAEDEDRRTQLIQTIDAVQGAMNGVQLAVLGYVEAHGGTIAARTQATLVQSVRTANAVTQAINEVDRTTSALVELMRVRGSVAKAFEGDIELLSQARRVEGHLARVERLRVMLPNLWAFAQESSMRTIALIRSNEFDGAANNLVFEERARVAGVTNAVRELSQALSDMADAVVKDANERADQRLVMIEAEDEQRQLMSLALVASVLVVSVLMAVLAGTRMITRPLNRAIAAMGALARDELDHPIPAAGRDEVGQMLTALQVFRDQALENRQLRHAQDEAKAAAEAQRRAELAKLATEFESSVKGVAEDVSARAGTITVAARQVSSIAQDATRLTAHVASSAEQASANVQTVAAAANELAASIAEIGRQVSESGRIAGGAVEEAQRTDHLVESLAEGARAIGGVLDLINEIAEQTHMLALNATIEAARAGEAGRGFAVVASEVKTLAAQTSKATEEIAAQVAGMQSATSNAVQAIRGIGATIVRIDQIATIIAAAVEEQQAATAEIARNVQQAAEGTHSVTETVADVSRGAQETGSAAHSLESGANSLAAQSQRLTTEVDRFLSSIRAA